MTAAIPGLALIAIYAAWRIIRDRAAELADFAAWEREVEEQWH